MLTVRATQTSITDAKAKTRKTAVKHNKIDREI